MYRSFSLQELRHYSNAPTAEQSQAPSADYQDNMMKYLSQDYNEFHESSTRAQHLISIMAKISDFVI